MGRVKAQPRVAICRNPRLPLKAPRHHGEGGSRPCGGLAICWTADIRGFPSSDSLKVSFHSTGGTPRASPAVEPATKCETKSSPSKRSRERHTDMTEDTVVTLNVPIYCGSAPAANKAMVTRLECDVLSIKASGVFPFLSRRLTGDPFCRLAEMINTILSNSAAECPRS